MTTGIYKITNKINRHSYIGFSVNIEHRFSDHRTKPFSSTKKDDLDKVLYKAIRKYGVDNFDFEVIEECPQDIELLKQREQYWIAYYKTYLNREDYNETPGGDCAGEKSIHKGEKHGMAKLTNAEVKQCRIWYKEGKRSRDIWNKYFSEKITYEGFLRMWHGQTWKEIMPEVFEYNPHPKAYKEKDCENIRQKFFASGLSLRQFQKTSECYVGYGTLWKMINIPEFYKDK